VQTSLKRQSAEIKQLKTRADDRRSVGTGKSWLLLALGTLSVVTGYAQVMPGMRAPADMVDAAVMAVTSACWLASAGRPVFGINLPAKGNAGEGVSEHRSAPAWVKKAGDAKGRSRFSTLASPEGMIWIRFDEDTARCSLIVRPTDVAKFRAAFGDSLATGGPADLKRESAADGSESIVNETPTFVWTSRVSVPPKMPDVVLIETSFRPK
jgi:hypothetical protein